MGLSMYTRALIGTMLELGSISHESFSLCFNRRGGHMSLGGIINEKNEFHSQQHTNVARHLTPMQFTPFARESFRYYSVTVTAVSVGPHILPKGIVQFLNEESKGTIIDSGTTDTFLSHRVSKVRSLSYLSMESSSLLAVKIYFIEYCVLAFVALRISSHCYASYFTLNGL